MKRGGGAKIGGPISLLDNQCNGSALGQMVPVSSLCPAAGLLSGEGAGLERERDV